MAGSPMKAIEELISLGIERCPECHCAVGDDWDYKDFSNKTIVVCPQCGEEIHLDALEHVIEVPLSVTKKWAGWDKNGKEGKPIIDEEHKEAPQ